MIITLEWLEKHDACSGSRAEWERRKMVGIDGLSLVKELMALKEEYALDWATWLIVRLMDVPQRTEHNIFAARLVLPIFEGRHPDDKRPRRGIEAIEKYLEEPTEENKAACEAAYTGAHCSIGIFDGAYRAYSASMAAAYAVLSYSSLDSPHAVGNAAANAAGSLAAREEVQRKMLENGIRILESK